MSRFEVHYEHFKREDTTNSMVVNLYNDDGTAITPNSGHTWVGKIAKDDKYVGEYPLTISGTEIILPSSSLTRLPFGEYQLELWETTGGQTTIYPNAGFIPVTIHRNADDTMGEVDPTTDINKIIADLKTAGTNIKVGSTTTLVAGSQAAVSQTIANGQNTINFAIPRGAQGIQGPKGETGTVDNVGLTTAPAFVNLQTQVNNSAVGTNLIAQSELKMGYIRKGDGALVDYSGNDFHSDNYIATDGKTVFTFSSPDYVFKGASSHTLAMYDSDKNYLGYQNITSATQTLSKPNVAYIRFSIHFTDEGGTYNNLSDWLDNHRYKLEKGSVVTDWCPNPSEILTQSDYAKIKAAIVALGGALS